MARWTPSDIATLRVGTIIWDNSPGAGYLGGVVGIREGAVDVRWLKWDPRHEAPMADSLYTNVIYPTINTLVRGKNETEAEFVASIERRLSEAFGRPFSIYELVSVFDRYAY